MLYHTINILLSTMCVVMRHWGTWHSSRWIKIVPIYWMVWHMLGHITNLSHWQTSFRFIVLKSYRLWIVFYWIAQASSSQISGRCSVVNACCYVAMSQLTPIIPFWGPVPLLALSSFAWDRFFNRRNLMFWNLFSLILDPILKFNIWLLYAKKETHHHHWQSPCAKTRSVPGRSLIYCRPTQKKGFQKLNIFMQNNDECVGVPNENIWILPRQTFLICILEFVHINQFS